MTQTAANSRSIALLVITVIAFAAVYTYVFDKKLDLNGDNANYYMLGKAISAGEGYVNINNIQKPPNNHFPPGYPVFISGVIALLGDSMVIIKLINGLLFLATIIAFYFLIRQLHGRPVTAIIVVALILLNGHLLRYATMIMTEVPFMFFSTIGILSFLKIKQDKVIWQDPWLYLTLILLAISFYIRTSGVALIAGIILYLLIIRKWQQAAFYLLGFILLALPWQIRGHKLGGSSYLKQLVMINPYRPELGKAHFGDYIDRFGNNVGRYISKEIPSAIFPFFKPDYRQPASAMQWVLGMFILAVLIYGIWCLKKFRLLIAAYLVGTLAILFLWPDVWVGVRFLLPVVPFLLIGLVYGVQELLVKIPLPVTPKYVLWLPGLICLLFLPQLKPLHIKATAKVSPNWANYFSLAKWINNNLDHRVVVACRKPTMFYLYSDTYTTKYKYTDDDQELIKNLVKRQTDYVVLEQLGYSSTYRYLLPAIEKNPDRFTVIKKLKNPDTYLLKLNSEE